MSCPADTERSSYACTVNRDADDTVLSVAADRELEPDELSRFADTVVSTPHLSPPPSSLSTPSPDDTGSMPPAARRRQYEVRIGESVLRALEVPVILGRRPRLPRIIQDVSPRLVVVDSPGKLVSGSHLSIRQVGSSLVVTDLRTTNGSLVTVPGSPTRRMRQGESVVVTAGTQVDMGDGIVLYILEAMDSLQATDAGRGLG